MWQRTLILTSVAALGCSGNDRCKSYVEHSEKVCIEGQTRTFLVDGKPAGQLMSDDEARESCKKLRTDSEAYCRKASDETLACAMKPFDERSDASQLVFTALPRLNRQLAALEEGIAFAINQPSIPGLGGVGGFEFYIQNLGSGDSRATSQAVQAFLAAARSRPAYASPSSRSGSNSAVSTRAGGSPRRSAARSGEA